MNALTTSVIRWRARETGKHIVSAGSKTSRVGTVLRWLCLLTAVANMGGNAAMMFGYELIYGWLGLPLPADPYALVSVLGFSFTAGLLALMIFLRPAQAIPLLVAGIVGKGLFALVTLLFHARGEVAWPWLAFAAWDAVYVVVFWLYLIHLARPSMLHFNTGEVLPGLDLPHGRTRSRKALLLYYSLSGNGSQAGDQVRSGLEAQGYQCDEERIQPVDTALFSFPLRSFGQFLRIMVRAILRRPAAIEPLRVSADHDYDLIVVVCQTWMLGMAAPVEAVFRDPANHAIFAGRDVAIVNVCRGLWRRSQSMLADWVDTAGGHLVGASAHTNPGWEPARLFSLFIFLAFGQPGRPGWLRGWFLQPQFLSEDALRALREFGAKLAQRPRAADAPVPAPRAAWEPALVEQEVA